MRELKFRAYDKRFNVMLNEIMPYQPSIVVCDVEFNFAYGEKVDERSEIGVDDGGPEHYCITDEEIEIMQYTGLKDKNGVEIYENDFTNAGYLIKWVDDKALFCECHFNMFTEKWTPASYPISPEQIIVIGNIYQNPELIPIKFNTNS